MKKALLLIAVSGAITLNAAAQTAWIVDNVHSNVRFSVSHLVISEVEGNFRVFNGIVRSSKPDFSDATVDFSVDVNSINTDNEMRNKHLRSDDFFNAERFPKMTFKSLSWRKIDGQKSILEGDLTIRDVTKHVSFTVVHGGTLRDSFGNIKAGFKATATINRFDYGLKWNALTEAGGAAVGKEVNITLNLELTEQKSS